MRRGLSSLLTLILAMGAAGGCTSDGSTQRPKNGGAPSVRLPSPPATDKVDLPIRRQTGNWEAIREWPRGDPEAGFGVSNLSLVSIFDADDGRGSGRVETLGGDERLGHEVPAGWLAQDAWLSGRFAVFEDVQDEHHLVNVSVYALDGPSGDALPVKSLDPSTTAPSMDVHDGRLVYIDGDPSSGMCVRLFSLGPGEVNDLECMRQGVIVDDVSATSSGISYSTLSNWDRPGKRCKQVRFVDWAGDHDHALEQIATEHAGCIAWSGTFVADGVAWDEVDPASGSIGQATAYFADSAGGVVRVGRVDTDSIVACGAKLYWKAGNEQDSTSLYSWLPHSAFATLSLNRDRNQVATHPACTDDRFLTSRLDGISGHDEKLTLMRLDASKDN